MKKTICLLTFILFLSCKTEKKWDFIENLKNTNKISVNELELKINNVSSKDIKRVITNDSVQILEYRKVGSDEYQEENCTVIDYRNNTALKSRMKSYTLSYLKNEIKNSEYVYKNDVNKKVKNTYDILENTYFKLKSFKNNPIVSSESVYYPIYLNNNSIAFTYMDGINVNYFSGVQKTKKGTFLYRVGDNLFYEIKIIDQKSMVQIWKDQNNHYTLLAPLKTVLKLPLLQTIYTEMDYSFEAFDKMNLEQIFNANTK